MTKWLIVGQGLAGSALALRCQQNNIPFTVIDNFHSKSSTKVAAGMWNPLVFKRLTKSWEADVLIPELHKFYNWAEGFLNASFFYSEPIFRILSNEATIAEWKERKADPAFSAYFTASNETYPDFNIPEGGAYGMVKQSGYVNLNTFIQATSKWLLSSDLLLNKAFDYNKLEASDEGYSYEGEVYSKVIFAEGFQMKQSNPYFQYLPMIYTKGEVLDIEFKEEPNFKGILNKGIFCVHKGKTGRIGSTYEWHLTNTTVTEKAKNYICENFENICTLPYKVIGQKAGIRPTVNDRRPLLGEHPHKKNMFVFNGLGTKGVMLAPFLSQHFVEHLLGKTTLLSEVDIKRHYKKHYA